MDYDANPNLRVERTIVEVIRGVMGDITYAEVEIVRFMNPKIRTRYQRPKEYVDADAF